MEYTNIIEPLTVIFVSFSVGVFSGVLWMFYAMKRTNKKMEEELDSKTRLLNDYEKSLGYEDDDYEAY